MRSSVCVGSPQSRPYFTTKLCRVNLEEASYPLLRRRSLSTGSLYALAQLLAKNRAFKLASRVPFRLENSGKFFDCRATARVGQLKSTFDGIPKLMHEHDLA